MKYAIIALFISANAVAAHEADLRQFKIGQKVRVKSCKEVTDWVSCGSEPPCAIKIERAGCGKTGKVIGLYERTCAAEIGREFLGYKDDWHQTQGAHLAKLDSCDEYRYWVKFKEYPEPRLMFESDFKRKYP